MNDQPILSEDWHDAQAHELEFWRGRSDLRKDNSADPENRLWWNQFWEILHQHVEVGTSAIEVGSGPTPMLASAPESILKRTAIEPLAEQFRETGWDLSEYIQRIAEPLESVDIVEPVDLVICVNVLDHMSDPIYSLGKMRALLTDHGYLFLWVHTQHTWYNLVYDYLPFRRHDHMHPHRFTKKSLFSRLESVGFSDVQLIRWMALRDPAKVTTLKERFIQKFAVSETLIVAKA